jgi:hypothetical protein
MPEITEQQSLFVRNYVSGGGKGAEAARAAGYSTKSAREIASQLLHKSHVVDAIRDEQRRLLSGELATIALGVLKEVMLDKAAPLGARVDACKAVLDRGGLASAGRAAEIPGTGGGKALSDMTVDELDLFIQQGSAAVSNIRDARALPGHASRVDDSDMSASGLQGPGTSAGVSSQKIIN